MSFLAIFPLSMVSFPGEQVNLHIFEERYKQLVRDCIETQEPFGIPPHISGKLCTYGGVMDVAEIVKAYPDGRLDVSSFCTGRFKLETMDNPTPGKLYAGAEVTLLPDLDETETQAETTAQLLELIAKFYDTLGVRLDPRLLAGPSLSFGIGHKIGLSMEQEYQLFLLNTEQARQTYLSQHLEGLLPSLEEMERTRARIRMNGHFQRFDPLTF